MRPLTLRLRGFRSYREETTIDFRGLGLFAIVGHNGAGKCLPGSTRVYDAESGEALALERFVRERRSSTLGYVDGRVKPVEVSRWHDLGERELVEVELEGGVKLTTAATHPVLTDRGCVAAGELVAGEDWVAEAGRLPACVPADRISPDEAELIGLLLGDGCLTDSISFTAVQPEIAERYRHLVERIFPGATTRRYGLRLAGSWCIVNRDRPAAVRALIAVLREHDIPLRERWRNGGAPTWEELDRIEHDFGIDLWHHRCGLFAHRAARRWAERIGIYGHGAHTKAIPPDLLLLPQSHALRMLAGLWLTDGWITPREAGFVSASQQLAKDVRVLLLQCGCPASLRRRKVAKYEHHYFGVVPYRESGRELIGQMPLVGRKAERAREYCVAPSREKEGWANRDLLPPRIVRQSVAPGARRSAAQLRRHAVSRRVFLELGGDPAVADAHLHWARVKAVKPAGRGACFDLTVDTDEHLYVADTLIVHNSTLIEGLTFALYGSSTWAQKNHGELLSDHGTRGMTVAVTFEARGETWEVVRTHMRSGGGSAKLSCLSNPGVSTVDGVRQIDPEIVRLIGLTWEQFCRCVVLPQGRFERLLQSSRSEQTDILQSLLQLGVLDLIREDADALAKVVLEREREITDARTTFLPDPAAEAASAAQEAQTATTEVARLQELRDTVAGLEKTAEQAEAERDRLNAQAEAARSHGADHAQKIRLIAEQATSLQQEAARSRQALGEAQTQVRDAERATQQAVDAGRDPIALERWTAILTSATETLGRVGSREARRPACVEQQQQATAALSDAGRRLASAAGAQIEAEPASIDTSVLLRDVETAKGDAEAREQRALVLVERIEEADERAARHAATQAEAEQRNQAAETAVQAANGALETAERALAETERTNAAAHAAEDCGPGDPCPVCARELPDGFVGPVAEGVEDARAAVRQAGETAQQARLDVQSARDEANRANRDHAEAAKIAATARTDLAELARHAEVDRDLDPRALLDAIKEATSTCRQQHADAQAAAREFSEAQTALRAAERELASIDDEVRGERKRLDTAIASLPEFVGATTTADAAMIQEAQRTVATAREEADRLAGRLEAARQAERSASEESGTTRERITEMVDRPLAGIVASVSALARALAQADLPTSPPVEPSAENVEQVAAWADQVEAATRALLAEVAGQVEQASQAARRAHDDAQAHLRDGGLADLPAAEQALGEARGTLRTQEQRRDMASAQIPGAERLDGLLRDARRLHEGLEAVRQEMATSRFVAWATARRQHALLVQASRMFEQMTGRYAFTEDFQVLDTFTGQPRSARTLSGGEMFLASLALALALVEIAGRAGGDLRALFLDEGFGSLDPSSLDAALSMLERHARDDRLIAMITHLPAVAERVEDKLEVTGGQAGSRVRLISDSPRDPAPVGG